MPEFKFKDQSNYNKLIGNNVLLMVKESFVLTEVKIIDITQHRIIVKSLSSHGAEIGVRKIDVVLFPLKAPKRKLKNLIKTVTVSSTKLEEYINLYAYEIFK